MIVRSLRLENFRNHAETLLSFSQRCNVLTGDNGQGKTNVLEGLSFAALTKSFYASHDSDAVRRETQGFGVQLHTIAETDVQYTTVLTYSLPDATKKISLNKAAVHPASSLVGLVPIVVLSPENSGITFGAPSERRRFLDVLLSQASKSYLADVSEYRQILRQRNRVLLDAKISRSDPAKLLEPWDEQLCGRGARIIVRRSETIRQLKPIVASVYASIAGEIERPALEYATSVEEPERSDVQRASSALLRELDVMRSEERRLGSTLIGPHRDDVSFHVDGLELRGFASQGQHKTFLVALKLAEFEFLKEQTRETPLLLLDDVFSELDERRSHNLLESIKDRGQTFITATDTRPFPRGFFEQAEHSHFIVAQGTAVRAEAESIAR